MLLAENVIMGRQKSYQCAFSFQLDLGQRTYTRNTFLDILGTSLRTCLVFHSSLRWPFLQNLGGYVGDCRTNYASRNHMSQRSRKQQCLVTKTVTILVRKKFGWSTRKSVGSVTRGRVDDPTRVGSGLEILTRRHVCSVAARSSQISPKTVGS